MKKIIFGMLVVLMCVGCKTDQAVAVQNDTTAKTQAVPVVKTKPATSIGKAGANVKLLNNAQEIPLAINTALDLVLVSPVQAGQLTASISTSKGLVQTGGNVEYTYLLEKEKSPLALPIEVNADTAGKYYVNVQVVITAVDGSTSVRSLALIVWAGEGAKQQAGAAAKSISKSITGVKILSAEETIKTAK